MAALKSAGAILIIATLGALLACKDDNKTTNNSNGQVQQFAPATAVALTDPNAIYTVTIGGVGTSTLRFPSSGRYQQFINGQTVNGTISNLQNNTNTWTATLTPDPNQQAARPGALTLTWAGRNTGTFTFRPVGAAVQTGTFTVAQPAPNDGGAGGNTNSNGGTTITSLVGRTLQLNFPTGGGEKFVFTSATAASYENGVDSATYQYDSTTGQINLKRSGGQTYHLILTPGATSGSTTVIFQEPGGNPTSFAANYTLQ